MKILSLSLLGCLSEAEPDERGGERLYVNLIAGTTAVIILPGTGLVRL